MRAHPSVVAFYRQLDRDAKQAANQKEGDDEEAVAEAELLNSNKATNNIINNDNTTNRNLDYVTIKGAAHCDDLRSSSMTDSASLRQARAKTSDLIQEWLN